MANSQQFCRLCFDPISGNFEVLDHSKVVILKDIALNLDLTHTEGPVVCFKCRDALQQSYDFKTTCLKNGSYLGTFVNCNSDINQEEESICRFCLTYLGDDPSVRFDMDESVYLKDMLRKCLPEIEPCITNQLIICHICIKNCQNMFAFITNCSDREDNLKEYIRTYKTDDGQIDLKNVLKIIHNTKAFDKDGENNRNVMEFGCNLNVSISGVTKKEKAFEEDADDVFKDVLDGTNCNVWKEEKLEYIENEEVVIKEEENCLSHAVTEIDSESSSENSNKQSLTAPVHKCTDCSYETNAKASLRKHRLTHKSTPDEPYIFKCLLCNYQTIHRSYLEKHRTVHMNESELKVHKCPHCNFQCRRKPYLQSHMSLHKKNPNVTMHKCTECGYMCRQKGILQRHMLRHAPKDKPEVSLHKCARCSFESYNKGNFERHMLVHKYNCELTVRKCTSCDYESKHEDLLREHMLVHECTS